MVDNYKDLFQKDDIFFRIITPAVIHAGRMDQPFGFIIAQMIFCDAEHLFQLIDLHYDFLPAYQL